MLYINDINDTCRDVALPLVSFLVDLQCRHYSCFRIVSTCLSKHYVAISKLSVACAALQKSAESHCICLHYLLKTFIS